MEYDDITYNGLPLKTSPNDYGCNDASQYRLIAVVVVQKALQNSKANIIVVLSSDDLVSPGGRVTNAVGTIFRKIFVGTCARPI